MSLFGKSDLSGVTVLVAEDYDDARDLLDDFLSMCGARVVAASGGREALTLFESAKPDIVVSDLWMPDGDGLELIRAIRRRAPEAGGLVPAISVSAVTNADEALQAGFHQHLCKPVNPLELLDIIRDFVRSDRPGLAKWTVVREGDHVMLTWVGHVTSADMKAGLDSVRGILSAADHALPLVVDLRQLSGFDPSVIHLAQTKLWWSVARSPVLSSWAARPTPGWSSRPVLRCWGSASSFATVGRDASGWLSAHSLGANHRQHLRNW